MGRRARRLRDGSKADKSLQGKGLDRHDMSGIDDPIGQLELLRDHEDERLLIELAMIERARQLRYPWATIGAAMGLTGAGAQKRARSVRKMRDSSR